MQAKSSGLTDRDGPTGFASGSMAALDAWCAGHIPGFTPPMVLAPISGGMSNPTFKGVDGGGRAYVLRKKPSGPILPSAHQIEREYRVAEALASTEVPVAPMLALNEGGVLDTPFYVMDFVEGSIFRDATLPDCTPVQRAKVYDSFAAAMAALHKVDVAAVGLADYGRSGNYFARQMSRWTQQYRKSQSTEIPEMERLIDVLPARLPEDDVVALVHGDFRLENLIFDPENHDVRAILDWELSTLGHPLADLGYACVAYNGASAGFGSLEGTDFATSGIPDQDTFVAAYCRHTGRDGIEDFDTFVAFALFRLAAIAQGVDKRLADGAVRARGERYTATDWARQGLRVLERGGD